MTDPLTIFHFTDFHWEATSGVRSRLRKEYLNQIASIVSDVGRIAKIHGQGSHVLMLGGDFCERGNYAGMPLLREKVLKELAECPIEARCGWNWNTVLAVPGNHDVDREMLTPSLPWLDDEKYYGEFGELFKNIAPTVVTPFTCKDRAGLVEVADGVKIWIMNSVCKPGGTLSRYADVKKDITLLLGRLRDRYKRAENSERVRLIDQMVERVELNPLDWDSFWNKHERFEAKFLGDREAEEIATVYNEIFRVESTGAGFISFDQFEKCRNALAQSNHDILRIALGHHHALPFAVGGAEADVDNLGSAASLNSLLSSLGFSLFFHGHIHRTQDQHHGIVGGLWGGMGAQRENCLQLSTGPFFLRHDHYIGKSAGVLGVDRGPEFAVVEIIPKDGSYLASATVFRYKWSGDKKFFSLISRNSYPLLLRSEHIGEEKQEFLIRVQSMIYSGLPLDEIRLKLA